MYDRGLDRMYVGMNNLSLSLKIRLVRNPTYADRLLKLSEAL